ncbi:MAG: hypothetical protein WKF86_00060 [Acidimicrobiales bacterium]
MTARSDHDQQETEARRHAHAAVSLAAQAVTAAHNGRLGEALERIRLAGINADLATQRAWPFLDR